MTTVQATAQTAPAPSIQEVAARFPDLQEHLAAYFEKTRRLPRYVPELRVEDDFDPIDIVYPIGEPLFVHLHPDGRRLAYDVIEPRLKEGEDKLLLQVREAVFRQALYRPSPKDRSQLETEILKLFDRATSNLPAPGKIQVPAPRLPAIKYHLLRDVARYGPLEPFTHDPYLEDIQCVGTDRIHVIHKFYDMLPTNVRFPDLETLDTYVRTLSERVGRPVSDARPIVDATLADGSRINIVYSEDVSRKGASFSIRRVHENPISVTQLIAWKTITPELGAYLWLCLENAMSVMICGEAACGKSATLNAVLSFIDPRAKVYSAEDTPEVRPPHPVWQRLLTRESGPEEARVKMFDLLKAALRSRPNYIVVGEIRGAEGAVAFQAMQTGHPTVATFHASNKVKMIQRLSAAPIFIPATFMDNLNVAVFQQALYRNGKLIRRVVSVDEIEGYSEVDGGIVTRPVFHYDPNEDKLVFKGLNNSYILERKIAEHHGYEDPAQIYVELQERARVLEAMVRHGVFHHTDVNKLLFDFHDRGKAALPFKVD